MRRGHPIRSELRPERRTGDRRERAPIRPDADPRLRRIFSGIGAPAYAPFKPDRFQIEALEAVKTADCLVTAPTGAGKTWIAQQAIDPIHRSGGKSWYATPLKALSNAKYAEFRKIYGEERVGILTGDRRENPEAPIIVGTTEILRNQLYDAMHEGKVLSADFVVLDEAHFLGDPERGVVWEEVMIYLPSRIPLLLLSATIGNAAQIAEWLADIRGKPCAVIQESVRPVPLFPLFLHPSGTLLPFLTEKGPGAPKRGLDPKVREYLKKPVTFGNPRQLPPMGKIVEVLRKHRLLPAIFFMKSRADCDASVGLCAGNRPEDPDRLARRVRDLVAESAHLSSHRQLESLERLGVASHHSGQLPLWKQLVETLMTEGLLDAVFATSTVAAGVNVPARSIVFFNSDRYNGEEFAPLTPTEFHQMTGRAGRRGMDRIGFAVVVPGKFMDIRTVAKLFGSPPSHVLSQIRIDFSMALNLLLSHTPDRIEDLLEKSFAAFQLSRGKRHRRPGSVPEDPRTRLRNDFHRHFEFLVEKGFAAEDGTLTGEGIWASRLRIDQPLLVAEGFRRSALPEKDPVLLAAIMASIVSERESEDRLDRNILPRKLQAAFQRTRRLLRPFAQEMFERGFEIRELSLRPAAAIHAWASGEDWENAVDISELEEGNLATLILRTADNLRHIRALSDFFPDASRSAGIAIGKLLRDPVVTDLPA